MDWQYDPAQLLWWGSAFSLLMLLATLIAVPWVVCRLPANYFIRPGRTRWRERTDHTLGGLILVVAKNLLGALVALLGVVMLFIPGQGLLTLLAGLLLMNFPGKYRMERALVIQPGVFKALNWLRARRGHPPFELPPKL